MTYLNSQTLFIALGFTAVILQGKVAETDGAERATALAKLIEEFCALNVVDGALVSTANLANEPDTATIDQAIDRHVIELRDDESTVLPTDKTTLVKFYDRLQQRKARRTQAAFYAMADVKMLADRVLQYLDEEIAESEAQ